MRREKQQQRQILFWAAATTLTALAALALQEILFPFVIGSVLAYALNPIVDRLERIGLRRAMASAIIVVLLVFAFAVIVIILIPLLIQQAQQVMASLPSDIENIKPVLQSWVKQKLGSHFETVRISIEHVIQETQKHWASLARGIVQSIWNGGWAILDLLAVTLITPVVIFYLLVDWPVMLKQIRDYLPRDHEVTIHKLFRDIDTVLAAFIRGQGLVCLVLGLFHTTCLIIIGLRYGLLIGIATGALNFIPIVGSTIGFFAASLLAIIQGWPDLTLLFFVFAIFATGQTLDAFLLTPRIIGRTIGLHPVTLILSLLVFSYLFGFVGTIVAVPLAAAIGVLLRFGLEIYLGSSIYQGQGIKIVKKD
ncbi:MAG: AI-2E family transporter [Hyphomicrobiaceae bacterium]|nr:AI-2E family transporter [Hyphomicrobiaceae bacterium]